MLVLDGPLLRLLPQREEGERDPILGTMTRNARRRRFGGLQRDRDLDVRVGGPPTAQDAIVGQVNECEFHRRRHEERKNVARDSAEADDG